MQTLPVIFSRRVHPGSYFIRVFDKGYSICPFSHVGIISECGNFVYEAIYGDGVVKTPLQEFKRRASYWETGIFPCLNRKRSYELVQQQLGKRYDVSAIFAMAVPLAGRDWENPDKWFCAELLAYVSQIFERRHIANIGVNYCYSLTRIREFNQLPIKAV